MLGLGGDAVRLYRRFQKTDHFFAAIFENELFLGISLGMKGNQSMSQACSKLGIHLLEMVGADEHFDARGQGSHLVSAEGIGTHSFYVAGLQEGGIGLVSSAIDLGKCHN